MLLSRTQPRRLLRLLAVITLGALGAVGSAHATTARVAALGSRSDFFTDETETRRWFAGVADYGSLLGVTSGCFSPDAGYHDNQGALVSGPGIRLHVDLDRPGRWGTVGLTATARYADNDPGSLYQRDLDGALAATYARTFGHLTAAVTYGQASGTLAPFTTGEEIPGDAWSITRRRLGGGLRADLGTRAVLDVAGELRGIRQRPSAYLANPGPADSRSWGGVGLRSRAFIDLGHHLILVPLVEFIHEDFFLVGDFAQDAALAKIDRDLAHIGLGLNSFLSPDRMVVLSVEWLTGTDNARTGQPADSPGGQLIDQATVVRLAGEQRLSPLLSARASAGWQTVGYDTTLGNRSEDHAQLSAGLSVAALRTALDLAVSNRPPVTLTSLALVNPDEKAATWLTVSLRFGFGP